MKDLPIILKLHDLQNLNKALDFLYRINIWKERFSLSEQAQKNVRWPLITSFQCKLIRIHYVSYCTCLDSQEPISMLCKKLCKFFIRVKYTTGTEMQDIIVAPTPESPSQS